MAKREVIWTKTAVRQVNYVFNYWNERNSSTSYSSKLLEQINFRVGTLIEFPNSGRKTEFKKTLVTSLGHYSLFYKYETSKIIITGFWDNRQDPSKLLDFLKN